MRPLAKPEASYYFMGATNKAFWKRKILGNKQRDVKILRLLRKEGWHVITIWQCALRKQELVMARLRRMLVRSD
jgi:G:T-mismatch repair DNA endonuclease (very short patch repair protein)